MMEWKTIESAPEDGVPILVTDGENIRIGVRKLYPVREGLRGLCYETFRDEAIIPGHSWSIDATHWMPLPAPPA